MDHLVQVILLLAVAVAIMIAFQRLHVPTSLGYLLVGLILGPHTAGPTVHVAEFRVLAEFGVVFLLFSIGLNYSLPQLHAMRHQILGLGTAQVALTTALVGVLLWLAGVPSVVAFVVGAVFAQSSSTLIGRQLTEQGEESTPHGRLALAISVFQDVTAVPFLILIPVLGSAAGMDRLGVELGWAMAKAVFAFTLVFHVARRALRPLFRLAAERRSAELFTLTVLLVVLVAAWTTHSLGLSLAFGAFLAGMMLGETEFRHQVESSIRPFRDVLLGLFFVGIGMLIEPAALPRIWHWALLGAVLLMTSKIAVVVPTVRRSGLDALASWRTALLLAVGGEFGFALLAIALSSGAIDPQTGQIVLNAVLFSLIGGVLLIRYNLAIATLLAGPAAGTANEDLGAGLPAPRVLIGGYGRVGHTVAVLLESSGVDFVVFDTDPKRVEQGRRDGHAVLYGDIADPDLLAAARAEQASLVIVTVDSHEVALRALDALRHHCPDVPVIARARDLKTSSVLLGAGAAHAYPEAIESSLRLGATALRMLRIPTGDIDRMLQDIRDSDYQPVVENPGQEPPR
ncbi:MAG: cation:proton antiporter [Pseudomonadota bacterium]